MMLRPITPSHERGLPIWPCTAVGAACWSMVVVK
jgi:hypothetical protein